MGVLRGSKTTEAGVSIYLASLSGRQATASNQQLRYGRLSRMHQLGLFIFWRVAERCGRSCFKDVCDTANKQGDAFICLIDACKVSKNHLATEEKKTLQFLRGI